MTKSQQSLPISINSLTLIVVPAVGVCGSILMGLVLLIVSLVITGVSIAAVGTLPENSSGLQRNRYRYSH